MSPLARMVVSAIAVMLTGSTLLLGTAARPSPCQAAAGLGATVSPRRGPARPIVFSPADRPGGVPASQDSQARVLAGGARAVSDSPNRPTRRMLCTAYCPCRQCCGPNATGITASGARARGYLVAADRSIPFHTPVSIPGYAKGRPVPVLDRGGAIKGDRLDLLFPTHSQARAWGKRWVTVTFHRKGA